MLKSIYKLFPIFLILIVTYYISTYWFQFTLVQGESMSPTLAPNRLVLVDKHTKTFKDGDIIIFYSSSVDSICIKRIMANPTETIEIKNGLIYVNNIESPFQRPSIKINYAGNASSKIFLPYNQYFVIGDNYDHSIDSRYSEIGTVSYEDILGKVIYPSAILQ